MKSEEVPHFGPWGLLAEHTTWTLFLAGVPGLLVAIRWPLDSLLERAVAFVAWTVFFASPFSIPALGAVICDWLIAMHRAGRAQPGTLEAELPVRIPYYEAGYTYLVAAVISGMLIGWICPIVIYELNLFLVHCWDDAFESFVLALIPALLMSLRRFIAARWRSRSDGRP